MQQELKEKWKAALRSGEYKQCTGALQNGDENCCLGVLLIVNGTDINATISERRKSPYEIVADLIGEGYGGGTPISYAFMRLNDNKKLTFPEIADKVDEVLAG